MTDTSLRGFLDDVAAQRRTVTVYADEPRPELAAHFADWNVEVRFDRLPAGTATGFVTVRRGEEFLGSVDVRALDPLFEPAIALARDDGGHAGVGLASLLELLDDTTFRGFDRATMLATSREIEDRAWRVGAGRLHAGFQRPGALAPQRDRYAELAARGVDVHVYFDGAWAADPVDGVTTHARAESELGRFWFLVFTDGTEQDCALVAEERDAGFTGFWTYDPDRVAAIDEHLRAAYW